MELELPESDYQEPPVDGSEYGDLDEAGSFHYIGREVIEDQGPIWTWQPGNVDHNYFRRPDTPIPRSVNPLPFPDLEQERDSSSEEEED